MTMDRRRIIPDIGTRVWSAGRWGPRRVRDTQCWATIRAEDVYTELLTDPANALAVGAKGTARSAFSNGRSVAFGWRVEKNSVWRRGRVFLEQDVAPSIDFARPGSPVGTCDVQRRVAPPLENGCRITLSERQGVAKH